MAATLWPNPPVGTGPTTIVNDANYQALNTDFVVGIGTLTAPRTVTLPPSSQVLIGHPIVIKDVGGNITALKTVTVAPSGSDTIDAGQPPAGNPNQMMVAYDACELLYTGSGQWSWRRRPRRIGICNGQSNNPVSLPSGVWTVIPLGKEIITDGTQLYMHPLITDTATVNQVGALPQASIILNAIPADWPSAGIVTITGPNIAGHDTVVKYTGTSAGTTLTGCSGGVGTLAVGQVVSQANHIVQAPALAAWSLDGIVQFPATASGTLGVRFIGPALFLPGGTQEIPFTGAVSVVSIATSFAQTLAAGPFQMVLQARQTSGATIELAIDGIEAPLLGGAFWPFM